MSKIINNGIFFNTKETEALYSFFKTIGVPDELLDIYESLCQWRLKIRED